MYFSTLLSLQICSELKAEHVIKLFADLVLLEIILQMIYCRTLTDSRDDSTDSLLEYTFILLFFYSLTHEVSDL